MHQIDQHYTLSLLEYQHSKTKNQATSLHKMLMYLNYQISKSHSVANSGKASN